MMISILPNQKNGIVLAKKLFRNAQSRLEKSLVPLFHPLELDRERWLGQREKSDRHRFPHID